MTGVPQEFAFTIIGRILISGVHVVWTVFRAVLALSLPFSQLAVPMIPIEKALDNIRTELTKGDYMVRVFSMDQAIEHMNLAIIGVTDLVAWFFQVVYESSRAIAKALANGESVALLLPAHKHIVCNNQLDDLFDNLACAAREFLSSPFDILFLGYSLFVELIFKSIVNTEENALLTLQRYDGISFPRTAELTCEYRDSISYDLTAQKCGCDTGLGYFHQITPEPGYPFGRPHYDPYCGQPNLQVNLFNKLERVAHYATTDVVDSLSELAVVFVIFANELPRSVLKATLNVVNMVEGDYFEQKVNCGYGMSSTLLRAWFDKQNTQLSFDDQIKAARDECDADYQCPRCHEPDKMPWLNPQTNYWKCTDIDHAIKGLLCLPIANPDGKRLTRRVNNRAVTERISLPLCDKVNKEGCMCNPVLTDLCEGHKTNGVSDDATITTSEDCINEYDGGVWNNGACKFLKTDGTTETIGNDATISLAKCEELIEIEDIQHVDTTTFVPLIAFHYNVSTERKSMPPRKKPVKRKLRVESGTRD